MSLCFFHNDTPPQETDLLRRLRGHLHARIGEYEGYGLHLRPDQGDGCLWVDFTALSNDQAAQQLTERFAATFHRHPDGALGFSVDLQTTFESIDHLQGTIDALVEGY